MKRLHQSSNGRENCYWLHFRMCAVNSNALCVQVFHIKRPQSPVLSCVICCVVWEDQSYLHVLTDMTNNTTWWPLMTYLKVCLTVQSSRVTSLLWAASLWVGHAHQTPQHNKHNAGQPSAKYKRQCHDYHCLLIRCKYLQYFYLVV